MRLRLPQRVEVEWEDCAVYSKWCSKDDAVRMASILPYCVTRGFLVEQTEDRIVVASTIGQRTGFPMLHDVFIIPRSQIKKIKKEKCS